VKGASVLIQFHGWRGLGRDGGPIFSLVKLGFVSVSFMPFLISERLRAGLNALKNAVSSGRVPPRAEMSAWGEDRPYHKRAGQ